MSARSLATLNKKLESIFKDNSKTRRAYNRQYGQVFIFDTNLSKSILLSALADAEVSNPEAVANGLIKKMKRALEAENNYGKKSYGMNRAREYAERITNGQVPTMKLSSGSIAYPVRNYNTVNSIKTKIGKLLEKYTNQFGKTGVKASRFTGSDNKSGLQLGHGELSASVAYVKTLRVEQALAKFGNNSPELVEGINQIAKKYNEQFDLKVDLKHEQMLTSRGGFKKGYTAVFSSQATIQNQIEGKDEKAFLAEVERYVSDNVFKLKGSPSLEEALNSVLLHNFATKKNLKVKTKKSTKSKEESKSKKSTKSKVKQTTPSVARGGIITKTQKQKNTKKGVASAPLALVQAFNAKLPAVIIQNMNRPALVNRTGTFANSVKVENVTQTPQGFLSFGYSYDKSPYQTFEPGFAQGSTDRDPRKLIDRSMRQIAVELAIGRFYTRRL